MEGTSIIEVSYTRFGGFVKKYTRYWVGDISLSGIDKIYDHLVANPIFVDNCVRS